MRAVGQKTCIPFLLRHSKHLDESWPEANLLLHDGHYFGIKSLSRLLNSEATRHNHLCTRCLKVCESAAHLASHKQQCLAFKPVAIKMPDEERAVVGFRKFTACQMQSLVIYADFESVLVPLDQPAGADVSAELQVHYPAAWMAVVVCEVPFRNNRPVQYEDGTIKHVQYVRNPARMHT